MIADNTATNRIILKAKLAASRYETLQADTVAAAAAIARAERPGLVIADANLPDGGGRALCKALRADPATRAIPVLIADTAPSHAARLAAFAAGADDYLARPFDDTALLAQIRNLLRTRATEDELTRRQDTIAGLGFAETPAEFARRARIALLAPSARAGLDWRRALAPLIDARLDVRTKAEALETKRGETSADAYVISADLAASGDGLGLVSELRSRPDTRHAVILVQDESQSPGTLAMALDIGATAVLPGQFDADEIALRLRPLLARKSRADALRASLDQRLSLATRDPLTGVFNRRYAEAYLQRITREAAESGEPFALMVLDLDRFKQVNDRHGHRTGDEILAETAQRLKASTREIDLLARYGGEEFVIAMPQTDFAAASAAAERLRRVIGERPMRAVSAGVDVPVTVSIGVAVCTGDNLTLEMRGLFDKADAALYASKNDGRNLVTFANRAAS